MMKTLRYDINMATIEGDLSPKLKDSLKANHGRHNKKGRNTIATAVASSIRTRSNILKFVSK